MVSKTFHLPACTIIICSSPQNAHYWPSRRRTYQSTQVGAPIAIKVTQGTISTDPVLVRKMNVDVHTSHDKSMTAQASRDDSVRSTENQVKDGLDDPRESV